MADTGRDHIGGCHGHRPDSTEDRLQHGLSDWTQKLATEMYRIVWYLTAAWQEMLTKHSLFVIFVIIWYRKKY